MKKVFALIILLSFMFITYGIAAEKGMGTQTGKSKEMDRSKGSPAYTATLTGQEVVPPVRTDAKGKATFQLGPAKKELMYVVTVSNLSNVTDAHIHMGKSGENGAPVAPFKLNEPAKKKDKFSGILAEGTIKESDLMGPLKGKDINALMKLMEEGNAYVNIHTKKYPNGELRGQIKK